MSKFDCIILPPDIFHTNFQDLFYKSLNNFKKIERTVLKVTKISKKDLIVKYRTNFQKENYPTTSNYSVGYGKLLDLCHDQTIVVGPCGTAMLQILKNNLKYFPYNFCNSEFSDSRIKQNKFDSIIYIADNISTLSKNLRNNRIYKKNYNINDLIFLDGISLNDMVNQII